MKNLQVFLLLYILAYVSCSFFENDFVSKNNKIKDGNDFGNTETNNNGRFISNAGTETQIETLKKRKRSFYFWIYFLIFLLAAITANAFILENKKYLKKTTENEEKREKNECLNILYELKNE